MNLHQIVAGAIGAVNPFEELSIQRSDGYTTNEAGKRTPKYALAVNVLGQVQALSFSDLTQINGLNIQGERRAVYINGRTDAIIREDRKGGDIVTRKDGTTWLVVHVLEYWPDWCKFVITRQDGA
jgi:hypothetical protein